MAVDAQPLDDRYIWYCRKHGVPPNTAVLSSIHNFQVDVRRSRRELCSLEIILDQIKDVDFSPLHDFLKEVDRSEIEAVDILNESSSALNGKYALSLMRAITRKLRTVDLRDLSFGKDFLRDLSKKGLPCQVLNLSSSHFRKLNMAGRFLQMHTLNLDFSTSLSCFREECFACMPNLMCLSMCDTRISNLWTTIAALSKLPSLVELRFQNWVCCNDMGQQQKGGRFIGELDEPNPSTEEAFRDLFSLNNRILNHDNAAEDSSDDSELDFSGHHQVYGLINQLSTVISELNGQDDLQHEVASSPPSGLVEEESSEGAPDHITYIASKYISSHASPICFEKHYREYMITSLPNLKVLDNLPIRDIDREPASVKFSQHFEYLPYRRKHKESIVSILHNREIKASNTYTQTRGREPSYPSGQSQYSYTRSLCAAKVGSSAWPFLQPLSISGNGTGDENRNFRPRQFEYHPSNSSLMVFGTLDGEVVVLNHENGKVVGCIPSLGAMNSVLGLCWLKNHPSKLIAGSDNGSIKLYDIEHMAPAVPPGMYHGLNSTTFVEFEQLTSVHVNSSDELFLASGYSKNVSLYDIGSGRRLQVFTDMHREHINVVKFANHSPSLFATSSFDQDVKMWDLRQKPLRPCYTASSSKGNVMVCFSPDDHYLLASAVDNEVKQLLAVDGRLHMDFAIPPTGSTQNYTRSYYMNGRDYIITGSCDEHVVRICCAQTGRRLKDISLEGKGSGTSLFVQSLRGDPFRHFNMSILAANFRPSSKSEIVKVNLLASSDYAKEYSSSHNPHPSTSMGA